MEVVRNNELDNRIAIHLTVAQVVIMNIMNMMVTMLRVMMVTMATTRMFNI